MKNSKFEKFVNPSASPEHISAVEALCVDLDPNSDLYKCLLQTANTSEIDKCFQQYSNKTGNPVIRTAVKQEENAFDAIKNGNISGNEVCPPTQMKHNGSEYIIDTHPDIGRWGIKNPTCPGKYFPDHEAQKYGVNANKSRCVKQDTVSKKKYEQLEKKLASCKKAFNAGSCDNNINEAFAIMSSSNEQGKIKPIDAVNYPPPPTQGVLSESTDNGIGTKPYGTFSITNHKQFKDIIKNYTPNSELPNACKKYASDERRPIESHPDINRYVLKTSIPAPKRCKSLDEYPIVAHPDITNYVRKESVKTLDEYNINDHSDIGNYVLKSTLPTPKRCKTLGEYKLDQHPEFADYKKQMENKQKLNLSKYARKDQCGNNVPCQSLADYDIKDHPDYNKLLKQYGINKDQCGKPVKCSSSVGSIEDHPDYERLLRKLKSSKSIGMDYSDYQELNDKFNTTKQALKRQQIMYDKLLKSGSDGCASNFVTDKKYNYEGMIDYAEYFTNPSTSEETSEEALSTDNKIVGETQTDTETKTPPKEPWDIRNHKDFGKYMKNCPKEIREKEDYGKYDITKHPDYNKMIEKYGAIKTSCGKLIPAPKCPCIVKDKCGKYKYKPCPPQKKCPVCVDMKKSDCEVRGVQTELVKSKIKLDLMISKYRELLGKYKQSQHEKVKQQRDNIEKELNSKKNLENEREQILTKMEEKQNNKLNNMNEQYKKEMYRMKKELVNKSVSDSGKYKFFHPTSVNYRMLEDK